MFARCPRDRNPTPNLKQKCARMDMSAGHRWASRSISYKHNISICGGPLKMALAPLVE
jgi:hypothetical protein